MTGLGESVRELMQARGLPRGSAAYERMRLYVERLAGWNERVNLVGSATWGVIGPLLEEAIWAASLYPDGSARHLDVGSGAGFPALPMGILRPDLEITLVESRARRAVFLESVISELALPNARVVHAAVEELRTTEGEAWDGVSWKAVRLGRRALERICAGCDRETRFWIFHGRDVPVAAGAWWEGRMELERRLRCPARSGWRLSIYRRRACADVSRETCG